MVHDNRVTACMARLGGIYRDPVRVERDASMLLRSEVGSNLVPIVAEMYENNGNKSNVLVLQGTIAIHFRGKTYQILVDQYLPPGYPNRPPIPFVRLAPNMYLKENHRHVGSDGKVYLPYLHEWRNTTHNLVELVVAMSSVFSAEPPVFTRRPGAAPATSGQPQTKAVLDHDLAAAGGLMTDEEAIAAVQAQEAKDRADAERRRLEEERLADQRRMEEERRRQEEARRLQEEERRQMDDQRAANAQREWELQRTAQVRVQAKAKIRQELQERGRKAAQTVLDTQRDLSRLQLARETKIDLPMQSLQKQKILLEKQLVVAEQYKHDIETWIEQATAAKQSAATSQTLSVDEKVVPERPIHAQMMELSAENAALTDALYFLDCAMHQGCLSAEVHLRQVRLLAKRQFLVRAHLIKINEAIRLASAR